MIIREFWGGRDWRFSTLAHSSYSARVATQQSHHLVCYSIIHFFLLFGSRFFSLLFLLTLNLHFCLISIIYYANEIRKLVTFLPFSFLLFSTFQQFALRKGTKKKLRRRKKSGLNFFSFLYLTDFSVKFFFFGLSLLAVVWCVCLIRKPTFNWVVMFVVFVALAPGQPVEMANRHWEWNCIFRLC